MAIAIDLFYPKKVFYKLITVPSQVSHRIV